MNNHNWYSTNGDARNSPPMNPTFKYILKGSVGIQVHQFFRQVVTAERFHDRLLHPAVDSFRLPPADHEAGRDEEK